MVVLTRALTLTQALTLTLTLHYEILPLASFYQNGSSLAMVVLGRALEAWGPAGFRQQVGESGDRAITVARAQTSSLVGLSLRVCKCVCVCVCVYACVCDKAPFFFSSLSVFTHVRRHT